MIVIADNLNTRNRPYMEAVRNKDIKAIGRMAKELEAAGADIINIQCSIDGAGDEDTLPLMVEAVNEVTGLGLCLDSRSVSAVKWSIPLCRKPPFINFLSATEPDAVEELLELVATSNASLIIRASKGIIPVTIEAKMQILEELIEEANAADIPNQRLFVDPSIVHIGRGMGQSHIGNSYECIRLIKEVVEPPINTTAWISNISSGLPRDLSPKVNAAFLSYLAGAGLDAAMVNVLDPEIKKTVYLIKAFRDELVFSPAEIT